MGAWHFCGGFTWWSDTGPLWRVVLFSRVVGGWPRSGLGFSGRRLAEELRLALLDAQFDPAIHEFPESLVDREALGNGGDRVGTDKAAHGFTVMDAGQFVVGPVPVRRLRVHAATTGAPADLILARHASGMHGAKSE